MAHFPELPIATPPFSLRTGSIFSCSALDVRNTHLEILK